MLRWLAETFIRNPWALPLYLATIFCWLGAIGYFVIVVDSGTDVRREEVICEMR